MSLRISMQTQSPWRTPILVRPEAMRSARSVTSAWVRRRSPETMPRNSDVSLIVVFSFLVGVAPHAEKARSAVSNHESPWPIPRDAASRLLGMRTVLVRKPRRALLQIGAHCLGLVRAADQLLLLDGFGKQRRARIDREIVEQALRSADSIGALAGDLARNIQRRSPRIVAD